MGECLQRQRAKQFKHLSSEARTQLLDAEDLFSKFPEMLRRVLNCRFDRERQGLAVGDAVFLVDQGEALVRVLHDQRLVGYVDTAGSHLLRDSIFSVAIVQNIAVATVHSIAQLTDSFTVMLNDPSTL